MPVVTWICYFIDIPTCAVADCFASVPQINNIHLAILIKDLHHICTTFWLLNYPAVSSNECMTPFGMYVRMLLRDPTRTNKLQDVRLVMVHNQLVFVPGSDER